MTRPEALKKGARCDSCDIELEDDDKDARVLEKAKNTYVICGDECVTDMLAYLRVAASRARALKRAQATTAVAP